MSKILFILGKKINLNGYLSIRSEVYLNNGLNGYSNIPFESYNIYKFLFKNKNNSYFYHLNKKIDGYINFINKIIFPKLKGKDITSQLEIDNLLFKLYLNYVNDFFFKKVILVVSLSIARTCSIYKKIPLYKFISNLNEKFNLNSFPIPILSFLNKDIFLYKINFDFNEFMIQPANNVNIKDLIKKYINLCINFSKLVYLINIRINKIYKNIDIIRFESNELILKIIKFCIEKINFRLGEDLFININCASSELYDLDDNIYILKSENRIFSSKNYILFLKKLINKYSICYIENILYKYDWTEYSILNKYLNTNIQIVGDDIFNNDEFLFNQAVNNNICNSILVEYYNMTTFSQIISIINLAKKSNYKIVISNIFRDVNDSFAMDLAIGVSSNQIKIRFIDQFYIYLKLLKFIYKLNININN